MATLAPIPNCCCTWREMPKGDTKYLADRDAACPHHGNDSDWWADVQARGEQLAANYRPGTTTNVEG